MRKFNVKDWEIEPELEIGNDGFIYGNYVEWDRFRRDQESALLEWFDVNIPWDKEITMPEYIEFVTQEVFLNTSIIDDYNLMTIEVLVHDNYLSEFTMRFPGREDDNANNIISDIFDYYEVPSGTQYEYELPDELQCWNSIIYNDYEYYRNYPIKIQNYEQTISEIQRQISNSSDDLTRKSLLLSSFIISESLFKSIIVSKIPCETNISEFSNRILDKEISKKLRGKIENKNKLFKDLYKKEPPKQEWNNLRNALAHNIEEVIITNDCIEYNNKKCNLEINDLFKMQRVFFDELKELIDSDEK